MRKKSARRVLTSAIKTLGSLPFAVALLLSLAALLAFSTFMESAHGTPFAKKAFYTAWWFDVFLSLLAVNILCSTLTRLPFKKIHIGFVITHAGILVLLAGAFLSRIGGVEGQMTLFEGEEKGHILGEEQAARRTISEGSENDPPNAAVHATLSSETLGLRETFWLIQNDPDDPHSFFKDVGPARLELETNRAEPGKPAVIHILRKSTNEVFPVNALEKKKEIPLGKDLTLSGLRYYPNAKVVNNRLVNSPETIRFNPAVEFEVSDAEGKRESHTKFFLFPDFSSLRGGSSNNFFDLAVRLEAVMPDGIEKESGSPSLTFHLSTGKWRYRARSSRASTEGEAELNKKITTGWMDITVEPDRLFTRAKVSDGFTRRPLPFRLALKDFRKIDYPGTSSPSAFESDVTLRDLREKITLERTISMNKPLDYKGWRIFQASYIQDPAGPEASVFMIAKNPGIPFIYSGAVIILIGVILLFYLHPFFRV